MAIENFVYLVHPEWDFNVIHAATTVATGWRNGASRAGLTSHLVPDTDLSSISQLSNPLVMLGMDSYSRIMEDDLGILVKTPHYVWIPPWWDGMDEAIRLCKHSAMRPFPDQLRRIHKSNPRFLMASSPPAYFCFYENWAKQGFELVSLPEACDVQRYYVPTALVDRRGKKGANVLVVGGYFAHKEPYYAEYLWPYDVTTYGYREWPRGYKGYMNSENEPLAYLYAKVCPAIGEPWATLTGSVYERPFKVLGSGGLPIVDASPAYRELFTESELLVPSCVEEYHEFMNEALTNNYFNRKWRRKGRIAVLKRHTYMHRVQKVLEVINDE